MTLILDNKHECKVVKSDDKHVYVEYDPCDGKYKPISLRVDIMTHDDFARRVIEIEV